MKNLDMYYIRENREFRHSTRREQGTQTFFFKIEMLASLNRVGDPHFQRWRGSSLPIEEMGRWRGPLVATLAVTQQFRVRITHLSL